MVGYGDRSDDSPGRETGTEGLHRKSFVADSLALKMHPLFWARHFFSVAPGHLSAKLIFFMVY